MNIFAIYSDPRKSAIHLVDRHVSKMALEAAQMLANCFSKDQLMFAPTTQKGTIRKHSYYNHPCSIWVRQNKENMSWLIDHARYIDEERMARFNSSPHFCMDFINWAAENIDNSLIPGGQLTNFAQAMPEEYKQENSVEAYRNYYRFGKTHLHSWRRNRPEWI